MCGGAGVILFFRDRGWHVAGALVAALAFAFGGSAASRIQHVGELQSLVYLPLTLWMLQRALERSSWPAGLCAGVFASLIVLGRDQVALIAVYVLAGFVVWYWLDGAGRRARLVASLKPLSAGAIAGVLIVTIPVTLTALLAAALQQAGDRIRLGGERLAASRGPVDAHLCRCVRSVGLRSRFLGRAEHRLARRDRSDRPL